MSGADLTERLAKRWDAHQNDDHVWSNENDARWWAAALVAELGVTREMARDVRLCEGFEDVADALTTLLDASEGK